MELPSIRRLALADLDAEETLTRLVKHGEDLLVERKRELPTPPKFGAAAASFANTLGGWILLGVNDDGTVHGYEKPRDLDVQSHLAAVLRRECDPLPPFVAGMSELDDKSIAVLKVFESADAPHVVRETGAVYVRTSKGKEPVDDHRTLLDLAQRGEQAERVARARLAEEPLVQFALAGPDAASIVSDVDVPTVVVRAATLTVTPQFREWAISEGGGPNAAFLAAQALLGGEPIASVEPHARGAIARKSVDTLAGPPATRAAAGPPAASPPPPAPGPRPARAGPARRGARPRVRQAPIRSTEAGSRRPPSPRAPRRRRPYASKLGGAIPARRAGGPHLRAAPLPRAPR
jgi:hypothetical protein